MTKHNFLQIKQEACPSTLYSDTNEGQRDGMRVKKRIFAEGNNETVRMGALALHMQGYGQRPQQNNNASANDTD